MRLLPLIRLGVVGVCTLLLNWGGVSTRAATNITSWIRLPWSSADGLPNNTVGGLAQTVDGFIWVGMPNGLARFDGHQFEELATTNYIETPNRGVLTMTGSRGGGLHLGMDRGAVVSLSTESKKVYLPEADFSTHTIYSLTEDASGAVWICYRGGHVRRIVAGTMEMMDSAVGVPEGIQIASIACEPNGRLWLFKEGQLALWRGEQFEALQQLPGKAGRITASRSGGGWVCADFHLYRFREGAALVDCGTFRPRLPGTEVSVMLEGRDGSLWIGTTFSGLYRYDGNSFQPVATTHQEIISLMEDVEGNIWVGMAGGGLNQVRPRAVTLEGVETGLPVPAVSSMCEDTDGVVWAALQNGALVRQVEGQWQTIPPDDTWPGHALSVCADPRGGIWVGTRYNRLFRWQNGGFVEWGDPNRMTGQTVHTLVVATNGDVWIGEDSPVSIQRLRAGQLQDFPVPPDIRVVRASAQDAAGNIWFGSSKGVLLRAEGDRLVDETARMTGEPQPIRYLYGTPDGSLWIGFAGWGVGRIKDGKYHSITARQGLHDDFISQIVADGRDWLWFGGDRGIFKVRQSELDDVCEGRADKVRSVQYGPGEYGHGDGRPSLQANFGNSPIALNTADGRIWLAMRTALAVIDPDKVTRNPRPPPVLLTRMAVGDNTMVAYGGEMAITRPSQSAVNSLGAGVAVRVPPAHRRMEFDFTALSFIGTENILFRYRLDGFDEDWVEMKGARKVVYPRLPKGNYSFAVTACNSEGIWNETGAQLAFVVNPFFWQTWWFQGGVVISFTALVIAIVRYVSFRRLRAQLQTLEQQAALYKERARIAKDIHDDLGASLTQIAFIGELAQQDRNVPDKVGEHVGVMSQTARHAVKSLDEIVWAVNPRNDTLAHFIDYTGQFALDYLRHAGIRCRLDLPEAVPARELSTDVRHNLFLVVKEAINNTVKYAHATELRLRIAVSAEKLELCIEDNGCGFAQPPDDKDADGLRNMRQRLADIGGRCWIQGRPGAGTKISLELPWDEGEKKSEP
jgi:signal transduction histidine kinase/ligand-binding sensor domain-containing protein